MFRKVISTLLFIGFISSGFAQTNLNKYKYVIVPTKFDFLKEADQYRLNSLTKFLFEKYDFKTIMENEPFPEEMAKNRCLALFSDVENIRSLLKTKLKVILKDCNNKVVFESSIGVTKEKEFVKAYNFALRDAFNSFQTLYYNYEPNEAILSMANETEAATASSQKKLEELKKEVEILKKEKEARIAENASKAEKEPIQEKKVVAMAKVISPVTKENLVNVLYAQSITKGFQLVDSTPKVVMILLETNKQDVFIVKGENAIVYKEDGLWYVSKNNGETISTETVNIKF